MCKTVVVNVKNSEFEQYMGRAGKGFDGYFGNAHPIGFCSVCQVTHDRAGCIAACKRDFWVRINTDLVFRARVQALRGLRLGCFCFPLACHADIYKAWLDAGEPLAADAVV